MGFKEMFWFVSIQNFNGRGPVFLLTGLRDARGSLI